MSGELLGRRLLRLDALYCAVAGLIALLLFAPLAGLLGAPPAVLLAGALQTVPPCSVAPVEPGMAMLAMRP